MENISIHEPLKQYRDVFKDAHNQRVTDYISSLTNKSNMDIMANKLTVTQIKELNNKIKNQNTELKRKKNLRTLLVFLTVLLFIATFIGGYQLNQSNFLLGVLLIIIGPLGAIFSLIGIKKLKKIILNIKEILAKKVKQRDDLVNIAWGQVKPLLKMIPFGITQKLINETVPLITMDKMLDAKRFDYLNKKYGLPDASSMQNCSVLAIQSGEIEGNPFVLGRNLYTQMGTKTYTGSRVISYTVWVTVNGRRTAQTRVQTLTASVTKPCPEYFEASYVIYGNEAAPDLKFNRTPSNTSNLSEKQLQRYIHKKEKNVVRKSQKAVKSGATFTAISNTEFDALFGALNRTNEVQFRLLMTPLAQREMISIIKDKEVGFGDDFYFEKDKKINIIRPMHLKKIDLQDRPSRYFFYDYEKVKDMFIIYNNMYFKHFYFALAPVLAIPLYQQTKPSEFIYQDNYKDYLSNYQREAVCNTFNINSLRHPSSITRNILKTSLRRKNDMQEEVICTANGYEGVPRQDIIMKMGGDGRMYPITVPWTEYLPVSQDTTVGINVLKNDSGDNYCEKEEKMLQFKQTMGGFGCASDMALGASLVGVILDGTNAKQDPNEITNAINNLKK